ncbi:hypothetical protein M426DRAFT_8922 [Hypoxylon sp. CI-4A]|nr:hypothetical protein M426DRAFT_8922 [Hypoxylon sp. CI-4A]
MTSSFLSSIQPVSSQQHCPTAAPMTKKQSHSPPDRPLPSKRPRGSSFSSPERPHHYLQAHQTTEPHQPDPTMKMWPESGELAGGLFTPSILASLYYFVSESDTSEDEMAASDAYDRKTGSVKYRYKNLADHDITMLGSNNTPPPWISTIVDKIRDFFSSRFIRE